MSKVKSAFDDLFEPEEAANLKIRSSLMRSLKLFIKDSGFTQKHAAEVMKIHQPLVSDLMRGRINRFSIDQLVNMSASMGISVSIEVTIPDAA